MIEGYAARATAYYQKTMQTTLVEMAQSGVILIRTSQKKKFYRLKSGTLDALLKPDGESPRWVNWPTLFKTIEIIWRKLCKLSGQEIDSLLLSSELKKLISSARVYCSYTAINELLVDDSFPIKEFDTHFRESLVLLSTRLFFGNDQISAWTSIFTRQPCSIFLQGTANLHA